MCCSASIVWPDTGGIWPSGIRKFPIPNPGIAIPNRDMYRLRSMVLWRLQLKLVNLRVTSNYYQLVNASWNWLHTKTKTFRRLTALKANFFLILFSDAHHFTHTVAQLRHSHGWLHGLTVSTKWSERINIDNKHGNTADVTVINNNLNTEIWTAKTIPTADNTIRWAFSSSPLNKVEFHQP